MPLYDMECENCGFDFQAIVKSESMSDDFRMVCAECGRVKARRVFKKAPVLQDGGAGSDQQISRMQKSFHDRFYQKDIDSVRHKHGRVIDDAIRGAELEKINRKVSKKSN